VFEKQDKLKDLEAAMPAIIDKRTRAVADLNAALVELAETRVMPDVTDEAVRVAEDQVRIALERATLAKQERTDAEAMLNTAKDRLAAAALGLKLRQLTAAQLREIEKLEKKINGLGTDIDKSFSDVLATVEDVVRLFGAAGAEVQGIVRGAIQLVQALETIDEKDISLGDFSSLANVIPQIQLAGSIFAIGTSLLGGLFGGGDAKELAEQQKEHAERVKENTRALEDVTKEFGAIALALLRQTTPGAALVPGRARRAAELGRDVLEEGFARPFLRDALAQAGITDEQLDLIRNQGFNLEDFLEPQAFADLENLYGDLSPERLITLLGLPTPDELVDAFEALGGEYENFGERVKEIIEDTGVSMERAIKQALDETVPTLEQLIEAGLGTVGPTIEGVREEVAIGQRFLGEEGAESFDRMTTGFAALENLPQWIRDEIGNLDFSKQKGLQEFIEDLMTRRIEGRLEGLSPEDADMLAEAFQEFRTEEADQISRSVQIARTITEIQANELIAIQETALLWLERIAAAVATGRNVSLDIDINIVGGTEEIATAVMEIIENEIALKEAS
jgi:hypothetical protein